MHVLPGCVSQGLGVLFSFCLYLYLYPMLGVRFPRNSTAPDIFEQVPLTRYGPGKVELQKQTTSGAVAHGRAHASPQVRGPGFAPRGPHKPAKSHPTLPACLPLSESEFLSGRLCFLSDYGLWSFVPNYKHSKRNGLETPSVFFLVQLLPQNVS